jgi:hypothetical protein
MVMMAIVRMSEMSVYSSDTTRRCIPEGSHLHVIIKVEKLYYTKETNKTKATDTQKLL